MPTIKKQEASIIEIIQKMIREGESEEKIVRTLKDLGVEEKKAKNLLLIGEADTFALLRSELTKIAKDNIQKELPEIQGNLQAEIKSSAKEVQQEVIHKTIEEMQKYEHDVLSDIQQFKEQEQEKINQISFFGEKVKEKINEMGTELHTVQLDLEELKVKGISGINQNVRKILIAVGLVFGLVDLFLIYSSFNNAISIDAIISMVLLALISVTMFFVATVI